MPKFEGKKHILPLFYVSEGQSCKNPVCFVSVNKVPLRGQKKQHCLWKTGMSEQYNQTDKFFHCVEMCFYCIDKKNKNN